jgi:hypothetical protein
VYAHRQVMVKSDVYFITYETLCEADEAYYVWSEDGKRLGFVYLPFDDCIPDNERPGLNWYDMNKLEPVIVVAKNMSVVEQKRHANICLHAAMHHPQWTYIIREDRCVLHPLEEDEWPKRLEEQLEPRSMEGMLLRTLVNLCGDDVEALCEVVDIVRGREQNDVAEASSLHAQ